MICRAASWPISAARRASSCAAATASWLRCAGRALAASRTGNDGAGDLAAQAYEAAAELGDGLPLQWIERDSRYGEKLATPDVSIADLVGEIDPIKVAEGRYLADEETIHYGLVPRTNRGVFAINELPDLTEKVQVGLFNLMEE